MHLALASGPARHFSAETLRIAGSVFHLTVDGLQSESYLVKMCRWHKILHFIIDSLNSSIRDKEAIRMGLKTEAALSSPTPYPSFNALNHWLLDRWNVVL